MQVAVRFNHPAMKVDETFSGNDADDIVAAMRKRVAKDLPFTMRLVVNNMSNVFFAREVVTRYNQHEKKNLPPPVTSEEFLGMMQQEGVATITT
jgi:hypothetical protein